jgi:hypothetical protein
VLVFGRDLTAVDGDAGAEEDGARGTTTARGFPCASIAMRAQPSRAVVLSARVSVAAFGSAEISSPGMTKVAVVPATAPQGTEVTGRML